ncbi:MAG: 2-amino-4-hydroxy-6-hydroxymethyldihydropteridine diphosphokinase [Candidatus Omnitrophota bacterium]|nr:2-amino-4-hydroxy-6-hydroxymethyldihydropteridine diphosphokinase [Candidatus Omnitrophota bacterium]MDZ4241241.1 2-amino-4-hydroxy-6-hydroxymethyldihydropteridine diphosphokinase [Candidatus Omnitrophota bacterium]
MATVFLGLGSNLGDRRDNILRAVEELKAQGIALDALSTIIETDPVGGPLQGKFLNAVARTSTTLSPQEVLKAIHSVEKSLGRVRTVRDGPRTIDIDILLYDDLKIQTKKLTVPHPRMQERDFVMKPLGEIAPERAGKILSRLKK